MRRWCSEAADQERVCRGTLLHSYWEKVIMMERIYHEGIREPLRWMVLAVFEYV